MSTVWLKIKVWGKLSIFFLILIYFLIFIAENSGQPVNFWYWYHSVWPTSLLYFSFFTFLAGVLVTLLARTIIKTISQFREMRRRVELDRRDRELHALRTQAAMQQSRAPEEPSAPPASPPPAGGAS